MIDKLFSSPVWDQPLWGNTLYDVFLAAMAFILLLLAFWLVQRFLLRHFERLARRTKSEVDDMAVRIVRTIKPPFYFFLAFYLALRYLSLNPTAQKVIDCMLLIWVVYQAVVAAQLLLDFIFRKKILKEKADENTKTALKNINTIVRFSLWIVAFVLVLSNMGVNVTSLIAGLGVGGIAVAFALQNILSDLFSSFSIYFDKPFVVGDYIETEKNAGTVEKIGIKSTRVRSNSGEEIVVSNNELTSEPVHNYGKMRQRRTVFNFTVDPNVSLDKVKSVNGIIADGLEGLDNVRLERIHLKEFTEMGQEFEVAYYTESPAYADFMDSRQEINYMMKKAFDEEGIKFSYPKYLQQ